MISIFDMFFGFVLFEFMFELLVADLLLLPDVLELLDLLGGLADFGVFDDFKGFNGDFVVVDFLEPDKGFEVVDGVGELVFHFLELLVFGVLL